MAKTPKPGEPVDEFGNPAEIPPGCMPVRFRSRKCVQTGPDEVTVYIQWQPLSREHSDMLRRIFPNLADKAFELLDKELVLQSMVRPD